MDTPRTLIICLEGAAFDLVEPWAQAGYLPALATLMAEGVHGPLRAWTEPDCAAAWASMVTGYSAGLHGVYDVDGGIQGGDTRRPATAAGLRRDPFWRLLCAAGKRVGVVNAPFTYPVEPIDGFMIAGAGAPDILSPGAVHPPDLVEDLHGRGIDYVLDVPGPGWPGRGALRRAAAIQRMADARSCAVLRLMETRPWDVLMAVFTATHRMQRCFRPGEHTLPGDDGCGPIRSLYRQVDAFIADARERAGATATVLVVSGPGLDPERPVAGRLSRLFGRLGLLRCRRRVDSSRLPAKETPRPDGVFIACGPDVKRGEMVENVGIYDIVPTLLYLQGHPVVGDMEGRVLTDAFTEERLRRDPVRHVEPAIGMSASGMGLDAEETRKIEERLRGLGYIE